MLTHTSDFIKAVVQALVSGTGLQRINRVILYTEDNVIVNDINYFGIEVVETSRGILIYGNAKIILPAFVKRLSIPIGLSTSLFYFHYVFDEPVYVDEGTYAPVSVSIDLGISYVITGVNGIAVSNISKMIGAILSGKYFPSYITPKYIILYPSREKAEVTRVMESHTRCVITGSITPRSKVSTISIINSDGENLITIKPNNTDLGDVFVKLIVGE